MISNGYQISDERLTEFQLYYKMIKSETRKNRNFLFESWDGYDFYDKEYIKDYKFHKNSNLYPTIDHKISILYGFLNDINVDIIGNIDNLCITKKGNNSSKNSKNYLNK